MTAPWQSPAPPQVSHLLITHAAELVRGHCIALGLGKIDTDHIVGYFRALAPDKGCVAARGTAERRADKLAERIVAERLQIKRRWLREFAGRRGVAA